MTRFTNDDSPSYTQMTCHHRFVMNIAFDLVYWQKYFIIDKSNKPKMHYFKSARHCQDNIMMIIAAPKKKHKI
jgi:hypothetical protein